MRTPTTDLRTMDAIDPTTEYGKLIEHPRLREYLKLALMAYKDIQPADREDIAAQAMAALWRRRNDPDPPNNLPRMIGLATTVLQGKIVDFFRHRALWSARIGLPKLPSDDGERALPGDAADQPNYVEEVMPSQTFVPVPRPAPDAAERAVVVKERLALLQEKIADGTLTADDVEVMRAQHYGEKTFNQLADERQMEPAALRQRISRIREALREAWNIRSTTLLVIMILLTLLSITIAAAVARRQDPPPPQRQERVLQWSPRGAAPEPPAPPSTPPSWDDLKPPAPR